MIRLTFICAAVGLMIATGGCNKPSAPEQNTKVGVILPLTGILSEMGQYEKQAMELAVGQLSTTDKNEIELIFEDGKGDNKVVAAAANKLLDVDGVKLLITSTTGASLTTRPIADGRNVPLLAFCMSSDVAAESKSTVRFYIGIEEESQAITNYLSSLPKDTRVGVLHASVAVWTTAVNDIYRPFLSKHFAEPAVIEEYNVKDKDFRAQITTFKTQGVQVLVLLGYGFEYEPIFTQMTELQLREKVQIVGGWGFLYTPLTAKMVEGIRVAGPMYVFQRGPAGSGFETAFTNKYGRSPNFDAAFAYEVISQLPEIIRLMGQSTTPNLKAALASKGTINGAFGTYHFNQDGNMVVKTAMGVFRNGQIVGE